MTDTDTATEFPCGHDHSEDISQFDPEAVAALTKVTDAITALDPERRNLLLNVTLGKIESMIEHARDTLMSGKVEEALGSLALAGSTVALAGMTVATTVDEQEDWTRTSDKKVDAILSDFAKVLGDAVSKMKDHAVVVTPDDVDIAVLKRVAAGKGTDEDHSLLKKVLMEKTGLDEDEIDSAMAVGPDGQKHVLKADAGDADEAPAEHFGMYL